MSKIKSLHRNYTPKLWDFVLLRYVCVSNNKSLIISLIQIHAELLIDGLGRASPIEDAEACIYGYGAVRFLANAIVCTTSATPPTPTTPNDINRQSQPFILATTKKQKTLACRLIGHGAIPLMILHLQMINAAVRITRLQTTTTISTKLTFQ